MGPNEYMARETMQIKDETMMLVFLTTVYLGKHVMITWDRLNGGIMQIWGADDLNNDEIDKLNELVWGFMAHYEEKT